jgi:hypothetical protein
MTESLSLKFSTCILLASMERYFSELATAFVRGRLGDPAASIDDGLAAGLRLHKFKQNQDLARVRRVLSLLRGLGPILFT